MPKRSREDSPYDRSWPLFKPQELGKIKRKQLQRLAKLAQGKGAEIKANAKSSKLIEQLTSFYDENQDEIDDNYDLKKSSDAEKKANPKKKRRAKIDLDRLQSGVHYDNNE
eukprot:TRINITY_DN115_c0_g1_i1.p2 TRINITY_DN115_c0_g1~~TRINITY_DN115_c0_g1_i1.p2  ORF type:complete len:111 (-),score=34.97 TRINITY_DN115_c0_g1_i1:86-418(-)